MAIQFNPNALSAFSNVNFGENDAIANLGEDNNLVQNGNRGLGVFAKIRFKSTKANNNAVRTELLKALGQAFNLQGVSEHGGKTTFSRDFMNRLEEILGPAFKRSDYGIDADGAVASGKPLTQRRIQAVYNAATDYAARASLNKKFEDVSQLLKGGKIADIIGDDRSEGWSSRLNDFAELAARVHKAAQTLKMDGDNSTITTDRVNVVLTRTAGGINARLTIDGETREVENIAANHEELCAAMKDTIFALYDSFAEQRDGTLTYGRAAICHEALMTYAEFVPADGMDTKKGCLFRNVVGELLRTKANVTDDEIGKLTNRELLNFAKTLCRTNDANSVKEAVAAAIKLNAKFEEASRLFKGEPISSIIGDNREEGGEEKAGDFAVLAAKVQNTLSTLNKEGDSATVEQGGVKVGLAFGEAGVTVSLTIDGKTRPVVVTLKEELHIAMDEAVSGMYDAFAEKKEGDLTYGRAALANKVLAYYKELAGDDLDTKADCPLRNFASGLLMTKARVTEGQIARLTNHQLSEFVTTLCQAGDASGIKELVASTIMEADEEDRKIEEAENALGKDQDDDFDYDLADDDQVDENKGDAKPQTGQLVNGYVNINAIDN